jgi:mRNA interferase RelE/StbE
MMFDIILAPAAAEFYANADLPLARKLARCFRNLRVDPRRGNNIKRLRGEWSGYLRYRVGHWRVIFRIEDERHHVHVVDIAHRSEIYD